MRNNKNGDMGAMQGALFLDKCIESGTPMHVIGSGSLHPNNCTPISGETEGNNVKKEKWAEGQERHGKKIGKKMQRKSKKQGNSTEV